MMRNLAILLMTTGAIGATSAAAGPGNHAKGCPPGLAAKSPACVAPGQAKKAQPRPENRQVRRPVDQAAHDNYIALHPGDQVTLDGISYAVVSTGDRLTLKRGDRLYRLPRHDGSEYRRIGNELVRVDPDTAKILGIIRLADLILN